MTLTRVALAGRLKRRAGRDSLLRDLRDAAADVEAQTWLVGGYTRDVALAQQAHDVDMVAVGGVGRLIARIEEVWGRRAFRFRKRGVTTWRIVSAGRSVDLVDATRRGLVLDLFRRDFSINAIAFDLRRSEIADPTGGLADLRARRLRMTRPGVLREDPLRSLRAARFMAQLPELTMSRSVAREARTCARGLRRTSAERVRFELDRLLAAADPARGLRALERLQLLDAVLPELAPLKSCVAGDRRPDVWRHTLACLDFSAHRRGLPGRHAARTGDALSVLRWALLLHDISKPETLALRSDGRPSFHGHETLGAARADALLRRLRVSRALRRRVVRLIRLHLRPSLLTEGGPTRRGLERLVRAAGADLPLLAFHAACDALGSGSEDAQRRWRRLRRVLRDLLELGERRGRTPLPRLVDGRDVQQLMGIEPGRAVGRALESVRAAQESGEICSREQARELLRRLARE